jgi:hypothetical protein
MMAIMANNRFRIITAMLRKDNQFIIDMATLRATVVALDEDDFLTRPMSGTRNVSLIVVGKKRPSIIIRRGGNRIMTRQETYWCPIIIDVPVVPAAVPDKTERTLK